MDVKYPWWEMYLDNFLKNYSREEVASELNLTGKSCLDIACGDGFLVNRLLKERYKNLVGVDISPDLIKIAKSEGSKNTVFLVDDIDHFVDTSIKKNQKFDDIYMLAILEHIFWPKLFVQKIANLVKRGGRVVVEMPNVAWLPHRIRLLLGRFPETAPTLGAMPGIHEEHIRFYTYSSLNELFAENGFEYIRSSCSGRLRVLKNIYKPLLAPDIVAVFRKK